MGRLRMLFFACLSAAVTYGVNPWRVCVAWEPGFTTWEDQGCGLIKEEAACNGEANEKCKWASGTCNDYRILSATSGLDTEVRKLVFGEDGINEDFILIKMGGYSDIIQKTKAWRAPFADEDRLCDIGGMPFIRTEQRNRCGDCEDLPLSLGVDKLEFENACCVDFPPSYTKTTIPMVYDRAKFEGQDASLVYVFGNTDFQRAVSLIVNYLAAVAVFFFVWHNFIDKKSFIWAEYENSATLKSMWESLYFSITTYTTIGYGDNSPRSLPAKFITAIYMLLSMVVYAYSTGIIISAVDELRGSINGLQELPQLSGKIICYPGYYYYLFAPKYDMAIPVPGGFAGKGGCIDQITKGEADVLIYDLPIITTSVDIGNWNMNGKTFDNFAISDTIMAHGFLGWVTPDVRYVYKTTETQTKVDYLGENVHDRFKALNKRMQTLKDDGTFEKLVTQAGVGTLTVPDEYKITNVDEVKMSDPGNILTTALLATMIIFLLMDLVPDALEYIKNRNSRLKPTDEAEISKDGEDAKLNE